MERTMKARAQKFPALGPYLAHRLSQRGRMAGALQWNPGIVIEQNEIRAPIDGDRKTRAQTNAERGDEALRPALGISQRRRGPVDRPHKGAHAASGCENRLFELRAHCT